MTAYNFDSSIISDLHKEARGYRPRGDFYDMWDAATDDKKQAIWDGLIAEMNAEMEREKLAEEAAVDAFKREIESVIAAGAGDRESALRWMTQGEEFYSGQCVELWVWERGILHTDFGHEVLTELKQIVTYKKFED